MLNKPTKRHALAANAAMESLLAVALVSGVGISGFALLGGHLREAVAGRGAAAKSSTAGAMAVSRQAGILGDGAEAARAAAELGDEAAAAQRAARATARAAMDRQWTGVSVDGEFFGMTKQHSLRSLPEEAWNGVLDAVRGGDRDLRLALERVTAEVKRTKLQRSIFAGGRADRVGGTAHGLPLYIKHHLGQQGFELEQRAGNLTGLMFELNANTETPVARATAPDGLPTDEDWQQVGEAILKLSEGSVEKIRSARLHLQVRPSDGATGFDSGIFHGSERRLEVSWKLLHSPEFPERLQRALEYLHFKENPGTDPPSWMTP